MGVLMVVVIFAVGLGGGLVAIRARESHGAERAVSLGAVFAGGIFLGAGLVHLLPDSIEALASYFAAVDFPIGYLVAAIGFLGVLFIEEIVFAEAHDGAIARGAQAERAGASAATAAEGVSAYAIVVILSIHSVLAGAALGTEDTMNGSLVIFIAIIAHKGAAGFALTLDFLRAGFGYAKTLRLLALFATMTPLGFILGTGLESVMHESYGRVFEGFFDALAAGTFLYVAIVEIIAKEFADRRAIPAKYFALCLGLLMMALIALWA